MGPMRPRLTTRRYLERRRLRPQQRRRNKRRRQPEQPDHRHLQPEQRRQRPDRHRQRPCPVGADSGNYTIAAQPTATANITAKGLTISGMTASNKVYDSTTTATLNNGSDTLNGVIAADSGNVGLVTTGASGAFGQKDVGNGLTVTGSGFTLSGSAAGNYTIASNPTTTANITPATLTVTGVTANNKVYDSTTTATLSTAGDNLVGVYGGDTVTLSNAGATGTFASKNVANGIAVAASGFTVSGAQAGDYTLTQPTGLAANITPATLTISGMAANNKTYDGTTTATLNNAGDTLNGIYGGDTVTTEHHRRLGTFASKNVGLGITITGSGQGLRITASPRYRRPRRISSRKLVSRAAANRFLAMLPWTGAPSAVRGCGGGAEPGSRRRCASARDCDPRRSSRRVASASCSRSPNGVATHGRSILALAFLPPMK